VLVDFLEPDLVRMRMGVGLSFVSVLVLMPDVVVVMTRMSVDVLVRVVLVLVLVGVGGLVCVLVGHWAPVIVWCLAVGTACGISGAPARRCAT